MSNQSDYLKYIHAYPFMPHDTEYAAAVRVGNIVSYVDKKTEEPRIMINLHLRTSGTGPDKGACISYPTKFAIAHMFRQGDMVHFAVKDGYVSKIWLAKPDSLIVSSRLSKLPIESEKGSDEQDVKQEITDLISEANADNEAAA